MASGAYHNCSAGLALTLAFRYLRGVRGGRPIVVIVCLAASVVGCRQKSKTPDEAYRRFSAAVESQDGGKLFDALDQESRWAWMTVQKWHREAYDIVLSTYPEGPERVRETRRFEPGATASSARELFRTQVAPGVLPLLRPLCAADARLEEAPSGSAAAAVLTSGARVPFARGKNGSWGFAGLAKEAEEQKTRAYHDLEVARASAADYERAAARAGK